MAKNATVPRQYLSRWRNPAFAYLFSFTTQQAMSLAPQFATHRIGSATSAHTLEVYLDLLCPFSKKIYNNLQAYVVPLIKNDNLSIIIRQVPQPWHATGTYLHEAVLSVARVAADASSTHSYNSPEVVSAFQKYFTVLINAQEAFYDEPTASETPIQIRSRLADLAEKSGIDRGKFLSFLQFDGNKGTAVTPDLKLQVRYARQNGVHVTPTVAFDGIIDNSISSGFTKEQWIEALEQKGVALN